MSDRNSVPLLAAAPAAALLSAAHPSEMGETAIQAATGVPQDAVEGQGAADEGATTFAPGPGERG